ncbi:MAG: serine hydrolase domain-containing protein [Syntrophomonadales bacterium]
MQNSGLFEGHKIWAWFILLSIVIGLLLALFSGSLQIKRTMGADMPLDEFKAHMDERIPALMKLYEIPGCSIALVKDGEIVWTEAYGYADVESGRALTVDTPMSVQSITKSVTAWGIMRLAEKGLIDLDAPVSQYLKSWQFPNSGYPTEKITTRQLLSHTAGMPLGDFNNILRPR